MYRKRSQINKQVKELFKHKDCSGLDMLDIGCGLKANAKYLKKKGAMVITVDIDSEVNPDVLMDIRGINLGGKYDIILCLNVLQFLTINEIKEVLPKVLSIIKTGGIIMIQMFDSPVVEWINQQLGNFKIIDYRHWIQTDHKPYKHTHSMVSWILRK